jgi:transposase
MYLRTTTRHNSDGSSVSYYQLAHNSRDPDTDKVSASVIYNFGRADTVDRDQLVRLCKSIARVCGVEIRVPSGMGSDDSEGALPEGVTLGQSRSLGPTLVVAHLWDHLGIGPTLRKLIARKKASPALERALLAETANRLCDPTSKLGVWQRWLERVYLAGCDGLSLRQMYDAMDFLHEHLNRVEETVFFHVADLFNLDVDLIFYDTTSCSFAIDDVDEEEDASALRQRGHSKEGTWTPQVVVALAVTREGLPVRSWVFPGNTADGTTIERIRTDLRGWKLGRVLMVADAGMNTADNRAELARACGRYLLACRLNSVAEVSEEVLARPGRYKEVADNLRVKEVVVGEGEKRRRYMVCFNPRQAEREAHHRAELVKLLEEELAKHPKPDAQSQWAAELRASQRFGRYLSVGPGQHLHIDQEAVKAASRADGKWVLITNDDTITPKDAADAYKGLLVIERCFRSLKTTQIRMRPMYHWLPRRIETHVKLCVLALLIQRVAERGTGLTWPMMRQSLERLHVTTLETEVCRFQQTNEPDAELRAILGKLGCPLPKRVLGVEPLRQGGPATETGL